jgi:predicted nucleic acid-binding protein
MIAVDTNILIYTIDRSDPVKWVCARELLALLHSKHEPTIMPWQVLGELVRFFRAKEQRGEFSRDAWMRYLNLFRRKFTVSIPTLKTLDLSLDLSSRYSLSHWDSMLLGACLEAGVTTLYTEDMGAPRRIDGLELVNPFGEEAAG